MARPSKQRRRRQPIVLPDRPPGGDEELAIILETIVGHRKGDKEVEERIRKLADDFLQALRLQESAPTARQLKTKLEDIVRLCGDLAAAVDDLPDFIRDAVIFR